MHRFLSPNKKPYFSEGLVVRKAPVERKREGGSTITIGFPVCTVSEFVEDGEKVAKKIALLLCRGES